MKVTEGQSRGTCQFFGFYREQLQSYFVAKIQHLRLIEGALVNEATDIGSGVVRLSISQIARESGLSRNTVSAYLEQCNVTVSAKRGYGVYRLADVVGLLTATSATHGTVDPTKLRPTDRNAWFQSELKRQSVEMNAGRLLPAAEHEASLTELVKALVQFLETLPDQLERDCALTPEAVDGMHTAIDQHRQALYDRIVSDAA